MYKLKLLSESPMRYGPRVARDSYCSTWQETLHTFETTLLLRNVHATMIHAPLPRRPFLARAASNCDAAAFHLAASVDFN